MLVYSRMNYTRRPIVKWTRVLKAGVTTHSEFLCILKNIIQVNPISGFNKIFIYKRYTEIQDQG